MRYCALALFVFAGNTFAQHFPPRLASERLIQGSVRFAASDDAAGIPAKITDWRAGQGVD
jgi:hypothetical protein